MSQDLMSHLDLKLNLFDSVSIDNFIFCAQKFQKYAIHFVPMRKKETKGVDFAPQLPQHCF